MKRTPAWYAEHQARISRFRSDNIASITDAAPAIAQRASKAASVPLYPLVTLCRSMKIPEPVPEYPFAKSMGRKWRADYCWPSHMLILECNGGIWTQGRHTRGQGAVDDMEKLSEAAIMGYRVIYCTPEQMHNGVALDRVIRALTDRAAA